MKDIYLLARSNKYKDHFLIQSVIMLWKLNHVVSSI